MEEGVQFGQQWRDNPKRSALARTFTVDSFHATEGGPPCSREEARFAYCSPMFAAHAGLGPRADAVQGFFANLDDFAPKSDRYLPVAEPFNH